MWLQATTMLPALILFANTASSQAGNAFALRFDQHVANDKPCPQACGSSQDARNWGLFPSPESLATCSEPVLVDYSLYADFSKPTTHKSIRACTLGNAASKVNFLQDSGYIDPDALGETNFHPPPLIRRASSSNVTCGTGAARLSKVPAALVSWKVESDHSLSQKPKADLEEAITNLAGCMQTLEPDCEKTLAFAYVRGTLVGIYAGSQIDEHQSSNSMLQLLLDEVESSGNGQPFRGALEICGKGKTAGSTFGVVADATGDFAFVQQTLKAWNEAKCASSGAKQIKSIKAAAFYVFDPPPILEARQLLTINPRADCRSIRVEAGEECADLAKRCGLGGFAFENFNKATSNFCSTLTEGQPVCCSSGTLPDITPSPGANGACATYEVKSGEGCQVVANKHGITIKDIEEFNKKTWGWFGCEDLQKAQKICVSKGSAPMPAPVSNAVCGPTANNTDGSAMKPPSDGTDLADMNPCPLDVCCNIWGQCGTNEDFCVISKSPTGAPGTSKPGENGCVSNCGMEIVNDSVGPSQYRKIGYFEAWNQGRPCLNMHVLDIDSSWTHVHFAFGEISNSLNVVIPSDQKEQWDAFVGASKFPKKILAFGGWAFSNEGSDSGLFRKAVSPSGRATFADNVVKFAVANKLDGVDFDWEYPGADDIEGSIPGEREDGENYYQFLKLVREKLPKDMTVSIAAPASYWYLRGFPIKKMAPVLDYIVYMTYDLHGQWDVGNEWASPGCPAGNCLRSHVNSTETHQALVMVTKAGVPSHKVVVGVSSYGRSFKMSNANCRGPQCTFLGERNESPAKKGRCTETGGYISDFEINEIIKKGGLIKSWYDEETDSDYLVYEGTEWVAYMSKLTKSRRTRNYKNMNFGGTSDWAIDLQGEGSGGGNNSSGRPVYLDPVIWETPSAKCQPPCLLVFPPSKLPKPTTIASRRYTSSLEYGATGRTTISGKETTAFVTKTYSITVTVPAITVTSMSFSNVNITSGQESTDIFALPSIKIAPIPVRVPDGEGGTTTRNVTLPPWPGSTGGSGSNPSETDPITDRPPPTTEPEVTNPPPQPTGGNDDGEDDDDDDLPVWTTWPPGVIRPTSEDVKEPKGNKTPCNLWFFSMCLKKGDPVGGFIWNAPPGKYPPGPPPPNVVNPPKGFTIQPPLPPWPSIKIGKDGVPTYSDKPTCETESASLCSTTTILSVTTIGQSTSTATKTSSDCETIYGCSLTDWETATTTRTDSCPLPTQPSRRSRIQGRQSVPQPEGCAGPAVVYPRDPENVGEIPRLLKDNDIEFETIQFKTINFVAYYHIPMLSRTVFSSLTSSKDVEDVYYYLEWNQKTGPALLTPAASKAGRTPDSLATRNLQEAHNDTFGHANYSIADIETRQSSRAQREDTRHGQLAIIAHPPKTPWPALQPGDKRWWWHWDEAAGAGQYVYMAYDTFPWKDHDELHGIPGGVEGILSDSPPQSSIEYSEREKFAFNHPTAMGGMVAGKTVGVCRKCTLVYTQSRTPGGRPLVDPNVSNDNVLQQFIAIYDDISLKGRAGRAVINMSFGARAVALRPSMVSTWRRILRLLDEKLNVVLVVCTGDPGYPDELPVLFGTPNGDYGSIPNMVVVGGSESGDASWSGHGVRGLTTTYAPADSIEAPWEPAYIDPDLGAGWTRIDGTSQASALVAGVAAYYRSVTSPWQTDLADPAKVKKLIIAFSRRLTDQVEGVPVVWNAQVESHSCLRDYATRPDWDSNRACPDLDDDLNASPPSWGDGGDSDGGSGGGNGKRISWDKGSDSPKCPSGTCGGEVCNGYYCRARPGIVPPDFRDPKDPNRAGGPNIGDGGPPGDEDDDDDEDEDDDETGLGSDWGVRYFSDQCSTKSGPSLVGKGDRNCLTPEKQTGKPVAVQGFTTGKLRACFYDNSDCFVDDSSLVVTFAGGLSFGDGPDGCFGGKTEIQGYRVTTEPCISSGYWGITWYKTVNWNDAGGDDKCFEKHEKGRSFGHMKTPCITLPEDDVLGFTAYASGDLQVCLFEENNCEAPVSYVPIWKGSPSEESQCFGSRIGRGWGSYRVIPKDEDCV